MGNSGTGVDGAALLDDVCTYIQAFVALSEAQAHVIALWVVHTHAIETADATPYLSINSPEKQSGKTRLLEVLEPIAASPWLTGRVTAATLYRNIERTTPTLLLDESDAAFRGDPQYAEALRGVLNTGYRRSGKVSVTVGQNHTPHDFSTFCPKAIAGIGRLPDTVADRSIPIRLKRAARGEVQKFRAREMESTTTDLHERLSAWCAEIAGQLRDARPKLPDELSDRQQDVVEPLLAIADTTGNDWPQKARRAIVTLCAESRRKDQSNGVQLLSDISQIFIERRADRLSSADLVKALTEIETSPWVEWKNDKPVTQPQVARLLAEFDIQPHNIRVRVKILKGYERADFEDAWKRYLGSLERPLAVDSPQTATPLQGSKNAGIRDFKPATDSTGVAAPKRGKANKTAGCSGVAAIAASTRPLSGKKRGLP